MRSRLTAVVLALMMFAVPALAQTSGELTQQDVEVALARRVAASASLEELTARYQQAVFDEEFLREDISELARSVSDLEREIGSKTVRVNELVLTRYMDGSPLGTERVFATSSFTDIPIQSEYFKMMNVRDLDLLTSLEAAEGLRVVQQQQLDQAFTDQAALVTELEMVSTEVLEALTAADQEYNDVVAAFEKQEAERRAAEEAARRQRVADAAAAAAAATTTTLVPMATTTQAPVTTTTVPEATPTTLAPVTTTTVAHVDVTTTTTQAVTTTTAAGVDTTTSQVPTTTQAPATTTTTHPPTTTTVPPPPVSTAGKTCPINAATSFSNTWGAPRSGGRTHKGVDITAVRNAPVVAIEAGTVTRVSNSTLGGLSIYLRGSSGATYYYAHLEYIESGITGGTGVSVGQLLGGNGTSGNSSPWIPHVHFQYAPPGFPWVNPYPLAKALCG